MEDVNLTPTENLIGRLPGQLSGGQAQRVAIARALVLKPKFVVADEPVSMLDVSTRAGVLDLMLDLRKKADLSYLFITHDLAVARYMCDRIAVAYLGKEVEIGPAAEIISHPLHPYTNALVSVVPVPNPNLHRERILLSGEIPNPINPPSGCMFHPRCRYAMEVCRLETPEVVEAEKNHYVACHLIG
jgi:peptide/nickel transport system ATP-binding protein